MIKIRFLLIYNTILAILIIIPILNINGETIEDKFDSPTNEKEILDFMHSLNEKLHSLRIDMRDKYDLVKRYYEEGVEEEKYRDLLKEIRDIVVEIREIEDKWYDKSINNYKKDDGEYSIWDQDETNLSQLIIEYGSVEYLYIIPPEITLMKLHIHSGLPIPRELWSNLLEVILANNGIGIKQLNRYTRQLYILKQDLITTDHIVNDPIKLLDTPDKSRVVYIFNVIKDNITCVFKFFEKFKDTKKTSIYQVGTKIILVSYKEEIQKLLTLYDFIWVKDNERVVKAVHLFRINPCEMEKILRSYLGHTNTKSKNAETMADKYNEDDFLITPLEKERSILLIGSKHLVDYAENLIKEIQSQIKDPTEMTIFWYACKHSDPEDVASVLSKVYSSLISCEKKDGGNQYLSMPLNEEFINYTRDNERLDQQIDFQSSIENQIDSDQNLSNKTNFIPYPQNGSILIIVRGDTLPRLKEIIKKLDVPKKNGSNRSFVI